MEKQVLVVTLHWKDLKKTLACLKTVADSLYPKRILVVNNGPQREGEIIKRQFPSTILIQNPTNLGYCAGNNQGLKYALKNKFSHVLIVNNDVTLKPDTISELVKTLREFSTTACINPIILFANSGRVWFGGCRILWWLGTLKTVNKGKKFEQLPQTPWPTESLSGACLLLNLELLGKHSLLDEAYFAYWEEVDLSLRIKRLGFDILVSPSARATHHQQVSFSRSASPIFNPLTAYLQTRNGFLFAKKNLRGLKYGLFVLASLTVRFAYTLIHCRDWPTVKWGVVGLGDGLKGRKNAPPADVFTGIKGCSSTG